MDDILVPSLKKRCLTLIALALWNPSNLTQLAFRLRFQPSTSRAWKEIANKVETLFLPESMKKELLGYVNGLGSQILSWVRFHSHLSSFDPSALNAQPLNFFWSPQGVIDKRKTAEYIVQDESRDIFLRFRFACSYCLDQYIPVLWHRLGSDLQAQLKSYTTFLYEKYDEGYLIEECDTIRNFERRLLVFWAYWLDDEIDHLYRQMQIICQDEGATAYQYAFHCAAAGGNEVATKYFLQMLSVILKEKIIVATACNVCESTNLHVTEPLLFPKVYYTDVLCVLVNAMKKEQQIELFQKQSFNILHSLLEWPWQAAFIPTSLLLWDFLSEEYFFSLIELILQKMSASYGDFDYQMLFQKFWLQSPDSLKTHVLHCSCPLLCQLFEFEDENIHLILKYLAKMQANNRVSNWIREVCEVLIKCNKFDFLQFLLLECASSQKKVVKVKKILDELKKHYLNGRFVKQDNLVKLIDIYFLSYCDEESNGELRSSKKVCR